MDKLIKFVSSEEYFKAWSELYELSREFSQTPKNFEESFFRKLSRDNIPDSFKVLNKNVSENVIFQPNNSTSFKENGTSAKSALIHVLGIPRCQVDCESFFNASSLTKEDIPALKKLYNDSMLVANELWKNFKFPPFSNYDTLINDSQDGGLDLSEISANYIVKTLYVDKKKIKPLWFAGFHLSKTGENSEDKFSVPYLHLHIIPLSLLTVSGWKNFEKTCPYGVVLDYLANMK